MKFAIIATDRNDARRWAEQHGARGFVVVTPRSPYTARGYELAAVWATDAVRAHPRFAALVEETAPAVCTAPRAVLVNVDPGP